MSIQPAVEEKVDPRIVRTRNLLGGAFLEILSKKGFQSLSVQDITEKAGVNRTTFYLHFADKYALAEFSVGRAFRQEIEKRTLNACHYTPENLRALILAVAEFIDLVEARCARQEAQFEALVEAQVKKQIQELLQLWMEQAAPQDDPQTAAVAASWAVYGLALQWSHEKKRTPVEAFADRAQPRIAAILGLQRPA